MIGYRGHLLHKNIFLDSGYIIRDTNYSKTTAVKDIEGLHKLIDSMELDNGWKYLLKHTNRGWEYMGEQANERKRK